MWPLVDVKHHPVLLPGSMSATGAIFSRWFKILASPKAPLGRQLDIVRPTRIESRH